ncbi:LolA family protein [Spirochaeta isovalerica]|uniref:Outer membrane lipoprotein-sorting protein n=1 Tax=Spirochaeta isovalerica TaxID=150 RepID=A0A841R9L6_9SPIO|nr:hypothetical protein [Spirochaeta isovalerica]MBB6479700.1 outer membrane lipoprotein-sorting protein [Spirochaeta isovalerica]
MKRKSVLIYTFTLFVLSLLPAQQNEDPWRIVGRMEKMLSEIEDYQCRMYEWSVKGRKEEIRYINFYFKKPRLIRMDIIRGNRNGDDGSIAVLEEDGKVTGRKGGILSPFAVKVEKDSPLATTIRGVAFDQSDAIAAWERLVGLKDSSRLIFTVEAEGWLFDFSLNEPENGITREVLFISKNNLMPLYTKSFEGRNLVQHVVWRSYLINTGLPRELFHVRYEAENLKTLGIRNNIDLPLELKE